MDVQSTEPQPTARVTPPFPGTLDDLLALDAEALRSLYEGAASRVADVAGDLRGRMLAIPSLRGPLAGLVRAGGLQPLPLAGQDVLPPHDETEARASTASSATLELLRFETFVGPSRAGAFDAVQLDYDLPANPFFIRAIKDEIRELRPGLYLGQAWVQLGQTHLGLYFGLTNG